MRYVRPVFKGANDSLTGLSLCSTNQEILVDEEILVHYGADEPFNNIVAEASTTWGQAVKWGECIFLKAS